MAHVFEDCVFHWEKHTTRPVNVPDLGLVFIFNFRTTTYHASDFLLNQLFFFCSLGKRCREAKLSQGTRAGQRRAEVSQWTNIL